MEKYSNLYTFEHKGYVLQQTDFNWHYMIFEKDSGKMVCHAQCTVKLDEESAKEQIEFYIKMKERMEKRDQRKSDTANQ